MSRQPPVLEGIVVSSRPSFFSRPGRRREEVVLVDLGGAGFRRAAKSAPPHGRARRAGWRSALILAASAVSLAGMLVFGPPVLAGRDGPAPKGLEFRVVSSETVRLRSGASLVVSGEIVNRAGAAVAVPAIRLGLRDTAGAEIRAWLVEPVATELAPGGSLGFRSVVAAPAEEAGDVTFALAERQGLAIRMQ